MEEDFEDCSLCYERMRETRYRPCGHAIACERCTLFHFLSALRAQRQPQWAYCKLAVAQLETTAARALASSRGRPDGPVLLRRVMTYLPVATGLGVGCQAWLGKMWEATAMGETASADGAAAMQSAAAEALGLWRGLQAAQGDVIL